MAHRIVRPLLVVGLACAAAAAPGCSYDEGLLIQNLTGRVLVPKEAATRSIAFSDGSTQTITDVRLLGPVYLGVFPSVAPENVIERYPHPTVGPQYREDVAGDAYPYGGTTVGDFRFACFEYLTCKVTTGRYSSYQDLVDWFKLIEQPITDASGTEVTSGEFIRQTCFDLLDVTSDEEVRLVGDLDFEDDGGDYFVADFTLWQQEFFWDQAQENCTPGTDCTGFTLWGWMDAPSTSSYQFSTCDPSVGFQNEEYNADFFGGAPYSNVLNFPATYISAGDYVAGEPYVWNDLYAQPDLILDFAVQ
ncbi:MAG: hypothetical protein ABMB14_01475 [Myxococcota bacterium]